MKRILKGFSIVLLFAFSSVYAEPAIIITDFNCGMLDGDGNGILTQDTKVVSTNNGDASNINLKCYASDVPNSTGSAVKYSYESTGFKCTSSAFGFVTDDWKEVVDAGGNAVLSCKFRLF